MNRRLIPTVWGLAVTAAQLLLPLAVRDRLPDPLATHWGLGGAPDGTMSFTTYLALVVVVWAAPWAAMLCLSVQSGTMARRQSRMFWWGALFGAGVFALGMNATTVLANLDASDWTVARLLGRHVVVVIATAFGAALLVGYVGRGAPDEPAPAGQEPPRLRLRAGQRTVWVGHVANSWLALITAVGAAGLAVLGSLYLVGAVQGDRAVLILPGLVLMLVLGVLTASLSTRVGDDRVVIRFGPLGWPARRIPLAKIESAWSEIRHPSRVGGWGFRGLPGNATIMLRGGDCLVIGYRSGGRLAISIDDAARGASLINALVADRVEP